MRVALTGAGGFVGQALSRALAARGHEVVPISLRAQLSIGDRDKIEGLLEPVQSCDVVINAAAAKIVRSDADEFVNRELPALLADLPCVGTGETRLVHISSMNVSIPALGDPYTLGKREAEKTLRGQPATIVRPGLIWSFSEGDAERAIRLFRGPLPIIALPWPGNSYRPLMVDSFADWLCDTLELGLQAETIAVLGDTELTMWLLLKDLARRQGARVIPVPTAWLANLIPPLARILSAHGALQQLLEIDRCLIAADADRSVSLPFPDLATTVT
jgi:uncharacterized protein YbjT (DUF2867 family)